MNRHSINCLPSHVNKIQFLINNNRFYKKIKFYIY